MSERERKKVESLSFRIESTYIVRVVATTGGEQKKSKNSER